MPRVKVRLAVSLFVCAAGTVAWAQAKRPPASSIPTASEWPTYGHDSGGMRFSPLPQITPANAAQLQPAWVYHMKAEGASAAPSAGSGQAGGRGSAGGFASGETTPLVINGVMYVSTP